MNENQSYSLIPLISAKGLLDFDNFRKTLTTAKMKADHLSKSHRGKAKIAVDLRAPKLMRGYLSRLIGEEVIETSDHKISFPRDYNLDELRSGFIQYGIEQIIDNHI